MNLAIHVLLATTWVLLTGDFTAVNFAFGLGVSYVILWSIGHTAEYRRYVRRVPRFAVLLLVFAWELAVANLRVAWAVIGPLRALRPGIVAVPLDVRSDAAMTLLANLITLTPGTLSLDISTDRRVLYVHAMHVEDVDAFRQNIKRVLERRVREALE